MMKIYKKLIPHTYQVIIKSESPYVLILLSYFLIGSFLIMLSFSAIFPFC